MNASVVFQRLLEATLNGGVQGLILTVLVGVGLRCFRSLNATTRHAVWFVCLLLVASLPVIHFCWEPINRLIDATDREPESGELWPGNRSRVFVDPSSTLLPFGSDEAKTLEGRSVSPAEFVAASFPRRLSEIAETEESTELTDIVPPAPRRYEFAASLNAVTPLGLASEEVTQASGEQFAVGARYRSVSAANSGPLQDGLSPDHRRDSRWSFPSQWRIQVPQSITTLVVLVWAGVALVRVGNLIRECIQLRTLKRRAAAASDQVQLSFERIRAEMGLKRKARLVIGPAGGVPLAAGFCRAAVVLPLGFLESTPPEQVLQVLRHELAHLLRWDDWSNIIQQGLRAVLFFHPAIWWITEQLSLEREIACDDHVLAVTPKRRSYALLLTDFAGRHPSRDLVAAPAVWSKKTQLKERIAMILDSKRNSSPRLVGTLAAALVVASAGFTGFVLHAAPRLALENENRVSESPTATVTAAAVSNVRAEAATQIVTPISVSTDPVQLAVSVSTDSTGPRSKPTPRIELVLSPTPAPEPTALPAELAVPAIVAVPPNAPIELAPAVFTQTQPGEVRVVDATVNERSVSSVSSRARGTRSDDASLEQRLDRLEKMMEKLMAEGNAKAGRRLGGPGELNLNRDIDSKVMAKMSQDARKLALSSSGTALDEGQIAKMKAKVEREAAQAARDLERAAADLQRERAKVNAERGVVLDGSPDHVERQTLEIERQALESTRHSLEKELAAIEQKLERLDNQADRLEERGEKRTKKVKAGNDKGSSGDRSTNENNDTPSRVKN